LATVAREMERSSSTSDSKQASVLANP
jgi:hypothetical protein